MSKNIKVRLTFMLLFIIGFVLCHLLIYKLGNAFIFYSVNEFTCIVYFGFSKYISISKKKYNIENSTDSKNTVLATKC